MRETIEHYRPRLENKLVLHFRYMSETQLEPYRLLGLRVRDTSGWIGKTGKKRTPRIRCDSDSLDETAIDAYLAEARPDLILHFGDGERAASMNGANMARLLCSSPHSSTGRATPSGDMKASPALPPRSTKR